ncbi:MAG: tetratricopeptide repeat protein [Bacteroidales bacterium]|nr:tetratricopeptide repeat protein [Bacteroidales bacterium]
MEYDSEDDELDELVENFKLMIRTGNSRFFDSDELESIIEELISDFNSDYADKAIEYAIQLYPKTYEFRMLKVKRLIYKMDYEQAHKELNIIEKLFPPTVDTYVSKVFFLNIEKKGEDVIPWLKKALQLEPDNSEVNFDLAFEYAQKSLFDKSLIYLSRAIRADEGVDEQLYLFACCFEDKQEYDEAIRFFGELTQEFPLNAELWFSLGLAYSWAKKFDKAIEAYNFAISLDDEHSLAYFNLGNVYYEMNDYQNAIDYYERAYTCNDMDFRTMSGIGDCYYATKQYDKALEYYRKSFNIVPTFADAIIGIISVLKETNRAEEAEEFVYLAFKNSPQSFELLFSVLPFYDDEEQIAKLKELFHLTIKQLQNKEDFLRFFTIYCAESEELRDMGIEILEDYLDNEEVTFVIPYFLAALHHLNLNFGVAYNYLKTALLINYSKVDLFLSIHPDLKNNPTIQKLILAYKP